MLKILHIHVRKTFIKTISLGERDQNFYNLNINMQIKIKINQSFLLRDSAYKLNSSSDIDSGLGIIGSSPEET